MLFSLLLFEDKPVVLEKDESSEMKQCCLENRRAELGKPSER